jgi:hypothetical protein
LDDLILSAPLPDDPETTGDAKNPGVVRHFFKMKYLSSSSGLWLELLSTSYLRCRRRDSKHRPEPRRRHGHFNSNNAHHRFVEISLSFQPQPVFRAARRKPATRIPDTR